MYIKRSHHPAAAADYAACYDPGILTVMAFALSAAGAVREGKVAEAQAKLQADLLDQRAESERLRFETAARDFRRAREGDLASLRAARGASGVVPTPGPLLDFAREAKLQELRILAGGKTVSTRLEQQAQLQLFQGRAARKAGLIKGLSLFASGAGQAAVDFSKPEPEDFAAPPKGSKVFG